METAILIGVLGGLLAIVIVLLAVYVDDWNIDFEEFSLGSGEKGLKIAHLADLHFPRQKVYVNEILQGLKERKADIVVITGDLVGGRADPETCGVFPFIKALTVAFPVFYVRGNHELKNARCQNFCAALKKLGVNVAERESFIAELGGVSVTICGASPEGEVAAPKEREGRTLLLLHRPEKAQEALAAFDVPPDLILSGHAHGGQFRLFGRGLYAPGQGVFPKYTSGKYEAGENTEMIVSRGIGASEFPFRVNNRPHIPMITIYPQ